ncbi:phosphatase PAP2 family protein [Jidongwangia harbinensis]|uniref:phosphatase PAP2 family protein n=1 Tax=Jidongwangia harbinensis TaxID=2878561 RepID=UPI001CD98B38|nr:phosphatase PAP2 family protein [Jidongwangia harbinensis]MCA2218483.1 phosphatase PAP2 family protein [Jidongwangia harbinensis]
MMLLLRPRWPAAAAIAFLVLAVPALGGWAPLSTADETVSGWFREFGRPQPGLIDAVRIGTDLAATVPYLVAGAAVTVLFAVRRRIGEAWLCGGVTVVVPVLWSLMHLWLLHPRPEDAFVVVTSNGFPSGHSSNAAAAAWVAVLLLWPRLGGRARTALVAAAVGFALVIGLTRMVLLAHYPSQVLGGWLLASAVVPALALAVSRSRARAVAGTS